MGLLQAQLRFVHRAALHVQVRVRRASPAFQCSCRINGELFSPSCEVCFFFMNSDVSFVRFHVEGNCNGAFPAVSYGLPAAVTKHFDWVICGQLKFIIHTLEAEGIKELADLVSGVHSS